MPIHDGFVSYLHFSKSLIKEYKGSCQGISLSAGGKQMCYRNPDADHERKAGITKQKKSGQGTQGVQINKNILSDLREREKIVQRTKDREKKIK